MAAAKAKKAVNTIGNLKTVAQTTTNAVIITITAPEIIRVRILNTPESAVSGLKIFYGFV